MKFIVILSILIFSGCNTASTKSSRSLDQTDQCKHEFDYAYELYKKAMNNAKLGSCSLSYQQFKEIEKQWKYLSETDVCTGTYKDAASSNFHRTQRDIDVLKRKYCLNL